MGDDDKDSPYSKTQEIMHRLANVDKMEEMRKDPELRKSIFSSILEHQRIAERRDKEKRDSVIADFKKLLWDQELDEAEMILINNSFLKKEVSYDIGLAERGNWNSINFLIDNGFTVNKDVNIQGDNLFRYAVNQNQHEVVLKLKNLSHDFNMRNKVQRTIRQEILEFGKKQTLDILQKEYGFNIVEEFKKEYATFNPKSYNNVKNYLTDNELTTLCKDMKVLIENYDKENFVDTGIVKDVQVALVLAETDLKHKLLLKLL